MADVKTKGFPSSLGAVSLAVGLIAVQLMQEHQAYGSDSPNRSWPSIDYALAPSTYGEYSDIFAQTRNAIFDATAEIQTFYQDLLSKQEGLGSDLEKALFANLWELYAR